jgi:3-oxoadipate enol-lactonase
VPHRRPAPTRPIETRYVGPSPRIALSLAGQGPLVLFLHGIGGNRAHWDDQLAACAGEFTACAWDARGYGDSDDYDGALNFADFSSDLLRVLDYLRAERAHLVGLSMGGRIARDFCLRYPERVATLVLCNTTPGYDALTPAQVESFLHERAGPLLAGREPRDVAPARAERILGKSPSPQARERLIASLAALRKDSYLKTLRASVEQDRAASIEQIAAPTLVVTSDEDSVYPPDTAAAMAKRIAGARLVVIERAGHVSNLEQPERFNEVVLAFLREYAQQT